MKMLLYILFFIQINEIYFYSAVYILFKTPISTSFFTDCKHRIILHVCFLYFIFLFFMHTFIEQHIDLDFRSMCYYIDIISILLSLSIHHNLLH